MTKWEWIKTMLKARVLVASFIVGLWGISRISRASIRMERVLGELQFSSVQSLSRVLLFATPRTAAHQASLSITNSQSLLKFMSIQVVMSSNHLVLCHPLLLLPSVFPSIRVFPMSQFFASGGQILESQLQHQSFQWIFRTDFFEDGLVGSPCSPRDSQESSPTPQFKSINSSLLSFLYSPTLTSIRDYWKDHSFDYTDLGRPSDISAF